MNQIMQDLQHLVPMSKNGSCTVERVGEHASSSDHQNPSQKSFPGQKSAAGTTIAAAAPFCGAAKTASGSDLHSPGKRQDAQENAGRQASVSA